MQSRSEAMKVELLSKIESREAVLGFVGAGYVGLPVSLSLAAVGFRVVVHDIDERRIRVLASRQLPFARDEPGLADLFTNALSSSRFVLTDDEARLGHCDVLFLAIDTPIDANFELDRDRFTAGIEKVGRRIGRGGLIIIESTIPPGSIESVAIPTLERASGLTVGQDLFLLHCPERLRPGRLLHNLRSLGRLIGGDSDTTSAIGIALYQTIVFGSLRAVHYRTAELVKTAENAARDVQIALANQIAVVCDYAGVDFREVRHAINELWSSEPLVLEAGPGVGGHCLPKDPWLLVSPLPRNGARSLVAGARAMNLHMVSHVAELAVKLLRDAGVGRRANITILGVAYNAESDDARNSPGLAIGASLETLENDVRYHDPHVPGYGSEVLSALSGADLAVLIDSHAEYRELIPEDVRGVMRTPCVLDTRRVLDAPLWRSRGFHFSALGVGALL